MNNTNELDDYYNLKDKYNLLVREFRQLVQHLEYILADYKRISESLITEKDKEIE
jgi:hypothetical protein